MKKMILTLLFTLSLGLIAGIGVQLAKWIIIDPELRIIVCTWDETQTVEMCKPLKLPQGDAVVPKPAEITI